MRPMREIKGEPCSLPPMEWVDDLIYFNGPILSHYRTFEGNHYLWYWCDVDDTAHRWLVLEVSIETIEDLSAGKIEVGAVIPGEGLCVVVADTNGEVRLATVKIAACDVPLQYQPMSGAFIYQERE